MTATLRSLPKRTDNAYERIVEIIKGGKSKVDRKVALNTLVFVRDSQSVGVKYHDTVVLVAHKDGTVVLNSGGWKTITTKERIHEFLPKGWSLGQRNGIWYLSRRIGDYPEYDYEAGKYKGPMPTYEEYIFNDGMKLLPDNTVEGALNSTDKLEAEKLRKLIEMYVKEYIEVLTQSMSFGVSLGDCFYCQHRKWGESSPKQHLLSHLEDPYYVPSLLRNAMEWAKEHSVSGPSDYTENVLKVLLNQHSSRSDRLQAQRWAKMVSRQIEKLLKDYLYHHFGQVTR